MLRKKISLSILFLVLLFVVCGCEREQSISSDGTGGSSVQKETIVDDAFNEKGSGTLNCTTDAIAEEGIEVDIKYIIDYKRGNIMTLRSISKIISNDQSGLDLYEDAYRNIASNYRGLKHYTIKLIRDSNTVTYDTLINYKDIDVEALLDIEGEEDNIIVDGKAKLSLWLDLAERVGTTCEEV